MTDSRKNYQHSENVNNLLGHYERLPFKAVVQEVITSIIKAALSLHSSVSSTFRKTAANFHYVRTGTG